MKRRKQHRQKAKAMAGRPHLEIMEQDVEDPMWSRDHDGDRSNPRYVQRQVNVRESAISTLAARGLLARHQVKAADRFRKLWERMGGAGAKAIDWRQEAVDGGRITDPLNPAMIDAGKQLHEACKAVKDQRGLDGYRLVCAVCGEGRSIYEMTETRRERDTQTDNLRAALDVLSELWGLSSQTGAIRRGRNAQ